MGRKGKTRSSDTSLLSSTFSQVNGQFSSAPPYLRSQKLRKYSGEEDAGEFVREATIMLRLQPMPEAAAASWILASLEGQARDQVLSLEASDIDTPEKIFAILKRHWGEHRDASTLCGAFYKRQQGRAESVAEYAAALRRLWGKANIAAPATLSPTALRDVFANGLTPTSMRRDVKRFLREREEATFEDAVEEAQRWMREDDDTAVTQQQVLPDPSLARLESQLAALTTETASLKQSLQEQKALVQAQTTVPQTPHQPGLQRHGFTSMPHQHGAPSHQFNAPPGPHQQDPSTPQNQRSRCWWCQRPGHREAECRAKQEYHRKRRQGNHPHSQQQSGQQGNY